MGTSPAIGVQKDDRIFLSTRIVAAIVILVLLLAFVILYFFPQSSGERFAWQIQPNLMAVYIGAGYLGGAYLFLRVLIDRRWHRVEVGFPAVTVFTISMLLATFLHWDRFDLRHFPFQLWLGLYIVTPVLIPALWLRNRGTDPGTPEPGDVLVPLPVRWLVGLLGAGLLLVVVAGFIQPQLLISMWVWKLSPLTARLLAGWGALLGVGNLFIARDPRWSAWRAGIESIALWHLLFAVGAFFYREDFTGSNLWNWYIVAVWGVLLLMGVLYLGLERRQRQVYAPA